MPSPDQAFDAERYLAGLDAILASRGGPDEAERYLREGLDTATSAGDGAARLTILNELLGLYRSTGQHDAGERVAADAVDAITAMGLEGTEAHATTLINVATAERAAGRHDAALAHYTQALDVSRATMGAQDRRVAALHNNLSILYSERGDSERARVELEAALAILEATSVDPGRDLDVAGTHTNLSLVCHDLGQPEAAADHAARSVEIFRAGGHERDGHFAAAVAGQAEASFRRGDAAQAAQLYEQALEIIAECYGTDADAYAVTQENLAHARAAAGDAERPGEAAPATSGEAAPATRDEPEPDPAPPQPAPRGLAIARAYWEQHVRPMLAERYAEYVPRIAAGLVGHGSECYGFDDATSRDHDFGPGVCLWLTGEDHVRIGEALQADYEALPQEFMGVGPRVATPRASGAGRRVGVFEIGDFYASLTGLREAPQAAHEWLTLDEATLAAATNGAVFADPLGAFLRVRGDLTRMPDDVRLARLGQRLGMMAQAGQYNVPRMLERGDGEAAWLAVGEFVRAAASAVFLLNRPTAVGYLPYYKWQFAALRNLAGRPMTRVPGVHARLSDAVRLASAACLGGAGFGEGGKGAGPARTALTEAIEAACAEVAVELRAQGLSGSDATFLEPHRDEVRARISDPWLRQV